MKARCSYWLFLVALAMGSGAACSFSGSDAAEQEARNPEPAHNPGAAGTKPQAGEQHKDNETPIPPERTSVTHHDLALGGRALRFTATAGTLHIRDQDDKPYGSICYVAYTLDGAEARNRPVSFLYNGGPGSASLWLHMGSFSPVRITTDSPNATVLRSSWCRTSTRFSTKQTWYS